jgi:hypothetical protein
MRLTYFVDEGVRRSHFVATGETLDREQSIDIPAAALDADLRAYILARLRMPEIPASLNLVGRWRVDTRAWDLVPSFDAPRLVLDHIATEDEAPSLLRADAERYRQAQAELETRRAQALDDWLGQLAAERERLEQFDPTQPGARGKLPRVDPIYRDGEMVGWRAYHPGSVLHTEGRYQEAMALATELTERVIELREAAERAEKEREAAERAEKQRRIEERRVWALAHGSARLRKCVEQGYDCQRLYVVERAAMEYPGYVVDFDDAAEWRARSGPSEAALDEAARVGGEVVWLTRVPYDDGAPEEYLAAWEGEVEAVVIHDYLGRYDLIKTM